MAYVSVEKKVTGNYGKVQYLDNYIKDIVHTSKPRGFLELCELYFSYTQRGEICLLVTMELYLWVLPA